MLCLLQEIQQTIELYCGHFKNAQNRKPYSINKCEPDGIDNPDRGFCYIETPATTLISYNILCFIHLNARRGLMEITVRIFINQPFFFGEECYETTFYKKGFPTKTLKKEFYPLNYIHSPKRFFRQFLFFYCNRWQNLVK